VSVTPEWQGAELGKQRAVPRGPLFSLFYLHCNKEIMNIVGICAYICRKVDYSSSLLGTLSKIWQEVVGYMDIKRSC